MSECFMFVKERPGPAALIITLADPLSHEKVRYSQQAYVTDRFCENAKN